jgi:hypothetical protein
LLEGNSLMRACLEHIFKVAHCGTRVSKQRKRKPGFYHGVQLNCHQH